MVPASPSRKRLPTSNFNATSTKSPGWERLALRPMIEAVIAPSD